MGRFFLLFPQLNLFNVSVNGSESESGFTRGCLDYGSVQHPDRVPKPEGKGEVCSEYSISGGIAKVRKGDFITALGDNLNYIFSGLCLPLQFCWL